MLDTPTQITSAPVALGEAASWGLGFWQAVGDIYASYWKAMVSCAGPVALIDANVTLLANSLEVGLLATSEILYDKGLKRPLLCDA